MALRIQAHVKLELWKGQGGVGGMEVGRACRPDSVRRAPGKPGSAPWRTFLWATRCRAALAIYPHAPSNRLERVAPRACLFDVAPDGVWPASPVASPAVSSCLAFSPLPGRLRAPAVYFLCHFPSPWTAGFAPCGLRRLAVSQHPVLRSPDLPPPPPCAGQQRPPSPPRAHCSAARRPTLGDHPALPYTDTPGKPGTCRARSRRPAAHPTGIRP